MWAALPSDRLGTRMDYGLRGKVRRNHEPLSSGNSGRQKYVNLWFGDSLVYILSLN